jgi:subtilase family serine protease
MKRNRRRGLRPDLDRLDDRCLLSGFSTGVPSGDTPAQIATAYGLNAITFTPASGPTVAGNGAGETIAVIEMDNDPNIQADLSTFDAQYDLPDPTLTVVNQAGSSTDTGWAQEESLDVEWSHAIARGASILVVEAAPASSPTAELKNLLNAVNTARNTAGVVAISMSWGFNEMSNEASFDSYFTTPAGHAGITFVASSGDSGTVEYPAASPYVVAVGGTTLNLSGSGAYGSESAWIGSGGGYSQFEPEPSYQEPVQQTGMRSTPDVAFDGDPNTGVAVYYTNPNSGQGTWEVVGGTSLGAPAIAAVAAIVDQGRAVAGLASMDGATQFLPSLYAAPATDFNTVSAASATVGGGLPPGGFDPFAASAYSFEFGFGVGSGSSGSTTSGATANTSTGLGTPIGRSLIDDLVASSLTTPLTTTASTSHGTTSAPTSTAGHHAKHHKKAHAHTVKRTKTHPSSRHERGLAKQAESKRARKSIDGFGLDEMGRPLENERSEPETRWTTA